MARSVKLLLTLNCEKYCFVHDVVLFHKPYRIVNTSTVNTVGFDWGLVFDSPVPFKNFDNLVIKSQVLRINI